VAHDQAPPSGGPQFSCKRIHLIPVVQGKLQAQLLGQRCGRVPRAGEVGAVDEFDTLCEQKGGQIPCPLPSRLGQGWVIPVGRLFGVANEKDQCRLRQFGVGMRRRCLPAKCERARKQRCAPAPWFPVLQVYRSTLTRGSSLPNPATSMS
jgi:hypothetical protein